MTRTVAAIGHIVEFAVLGVVAYRAECQTCGWTSEGFDREAQAVAANAAHAETVHA